jgi:5-methylcytosine-specific restriction endonuclease McrA
MRQPTVREQAESLAREYGIPYGKARGVVLLGWPTDCYLCGTTLTLETAVQEHYIPASRGGPTTSENLRWACVRCNQLKGAHTLEELLEWARVLLARFPLG